MVVPTLVLAATLALSTATAGAAPTELNKDVVRYVIDQDNELPVSGAIVVATWRSVSHSGHQICNRVESYVSDASGSFSTPTDSELGGVSVAAYKKGFAFGNSPRGIQMASDGNHLHAQIVHYKWNEANNRAHVVRVEPKIYNDRASAIEASRERTDAFLRKSGNDRDDRLAELRRLLAVAICEGGPTSTSGATPFFDAILKEQLELGASTSQTDFTVKLRDLASKPR